MLKKLIVWILVLSAIAYAAVLFGTPLFHYRAFKSDIEELVELGNLRKEEMRAEIQESIDSYGIPITIDMVYFEDLGRSYHIKVSWDETVNFLDLYEKTYMFDIDMRGAKR